MEFLEALRSLDGVNIAASVVLVIAIIIGAMTLWRFFQFLRGGQEIREQENSILLKQLELYAKLVEKMEVSNELTREHNEIATIRYQQTVERDTARHREMIERDTARQIAEKEREILRQAAEKERIERIQQNTRALEEHAKITNQQAADVKKLVETVEAFIRGDSDRTQKTIEDTANRIVKEFTPALDALLDIREAIRRVEHNTDHEHPVSHEDIAALTALMGRMEVLMTNAINTFGGNDENKNKPDVQDAGTADAGTANRAGVPDGSDKPGIGTGGNTGGADSDSRSADESGGAKSDG